MLSDSVAEAFGLIHRHPRVKIFCSSGLVKFFSFVFSLLSGQEKGFDKTLCVSPRTYGGSNHIRFAELGKEVSQIQ